MAIVQGTCNSFKRELLEGVHDFTAHTFKIALYTSDASLNADTTAYSVANEVSGTGYSAGGATLVVTAPALAGSTALVDFADVTWSTATITARGALIYNDTAAGNPAVAVLDFGSDRVKTAADFVLTFPAPDATNAIVRVA